VSNILAESPLEWKEGFIKAGLLTQLDVFIGRFGFENSSIGDIC